MFILAPATQQVEEIDKMIKTSYYLTKERKTYENKNN
jgi:hypothetical protein